MSKISQDAEGAVYNQQVSLLNDLCSHRMSQYTMYHILVLQRSQIYHWYHQGLV